MPAFLSGTTTSSKPVSLSTRNQLAYGFSDLGYDLKDDQLALMPAFSFTRRQVDGEFTTVDFFHFSFSNKGENEVVRVQL